MISRTLKICAISLAAFALSGCGGGSQGSAAQAGTPPIPAPVPTPTPPPPPPPTPAPVPTPPPPPPAPAPVPTGPDVLSEGDSISVFWGGNHTGIYATSRPRLDFHGNAVGGSALSNLELRAPAEQLLKPKVLTVLIGANDLTSYASAQLFVTRLFAYTATFKASGTRIAVATILPQQVPGQEANNAAHNILRAQANALIRAAVGNQIDAVIDFAADPVMGPDAAASDKTLYSDGLHPTDGTQGVGEGGQMKLSRTYKAAIDALLATIGL